MTEFVVDAVMDAALDYMANNITEMYVCSGDPTTRAAAITNSLATETGLDNTDWAALANGDTSGRKRTKSAQADISIIATGTAAVVCFCSGSVLIWKVDLATAQALTSGGTVSVAAVDHEIADVA